MSTIKLTEPPEKIILQTIDPREIADGGVRQTIEILGSSEFSMLKTEGKFLKQFSHIDFGSQ